MSENTISRSISVPRMLLRITVIIQVVLGLAFWSGNAKGLVPVHVVSGIIFVLSLITLAVVAGRAGVGRGLATLGVVWGLIVVGLGASQTNILHGHLHWIIQVIHLLVGLTGLALGERLASSQISDKPTTTR